MYNPGACAATRSQPQKVCLSSDTRRVGGEAWQHRAFLAWGEANPSFGICPKLSCTIASTGDPGSGVRGCTGTGEIGVESRGREAQFSISANPTGVVSPRKTVIDSGNEEGLSFNLPRKELERGPHVHLAWRCSLRGSKPNLPNLRPDPMFEALTFLTFLAAAAMAAMVLAKAFPNSISSTANRHPHKPPSSRFSCLSLLIGSYRRSHFDPCAIYEEWTLTRALGRNG